MKFQLKHVPEDLIAFVEEGKNDFERRSRIIAVKLYLMEVINKVDLKYGTVVAKRTIGEYNRTVGKKDGTYTEEMYIYGTPFKTAFAYIAKNFNHFFTRFKYLIKINGEEKVEIHRMGKNYSADSVAALLKEDHKAVHNVTYVTFENIEQGILVANFNSKKALQREYKLSSDKLMLAIEERQFTSKDRHITLHIVPSSVEPSYEKLQQRILNVLEAIKRRLPTINDTQEKKVIDQQIKDLSKELKQYDKLLVQDKRHNQKVAKLKAVDLEVLWDETALNLKCNIRSKRKKFQSY
ncbi:hypothetical protein [Lysinibacillus fusiformis]|uniref:hypothetical protein n=1 Tax=Lysinibacillus fusiformis TaxID=28031 RepID=UPI00119EAFD2|nr:hypothetical protein [Lysinibacillus fusiformis]